jgi:hypothetical protein
MRNQELQRLVERVLATFEEFIRVLERLGSPTAVKKAKMWKSMLEGEPSTDEISEVWRQVQDIGGHMGYFDFADPDYDTVADRLVHQMLDVVAEARRQGNQ